MTEENGISVEAIDFDRPTRVKKKNRKFPVFICCCFVWSSSFIRHIRLDGSAIIHSYVERAQGFSPPFRLMEGNVKSFHHGKWQRPAAYGTSDGWQRFCDRHWVENSIIRRVRKFGSIQLSSGGWSVGAITSAEWREEEKKKYICISICGLGQIQDGWILFIHMLHAFQERANSIHIFPRGCLFIYFPW